MRFNEIQLSRKRKWNLISVIILVLGLSLATYGEIYGNAASIFSLFALYLGTAVSVVSLSWPESYMYAYSEENWYPSGEYYDMVIPTSVHRMGKHPVVRVFCITDGNYHELFCDPYHDNHGNITITAEGPISGCVDIR